MLQVSLISTLQVWCFGWKNFRLTKFDGLVECFRCWLFVLWADLPLNRRQYLPVGWSTLVGVTSASESVITDITVNCILSCMPMQEKLLILFLSGTVANKAIPFHPFLSLLALWCCAFFLVWLCHWFPSIGIVRWFYHWLCSYVQLTLFTVSCRSCLSLWATREFFYSCRLHGFFNLPLI
jgi:hypothetical protein